MSRSTVVGEKNDVNHARTSHNSFLKRGQDAVVACIEGRASSLTGFPTVNIESLQVVWYRSGQEYRPHFDYFPPGSAGTERELSRGGQRMVTLFVYLNTVPERNGGATVFPVLNVTIPAVKNTAAFWYDMTPDGKEDARTLHGGAAVSDFEKFGLNIWIRQGEFN